MAREWEKTQLISQLSAKKWGIQPWIGAYPASALKKMLASGGSTLQLNDEATIPTVLAQLVYDAKTVTNHLQELSARDRWHLLGHYLKK